MAGSTPIMRFRFWLWLLRFIGLIVPRRLRPDWRQEWEAELRWRERQLAEWDRLDRRHKLALAVARRGRVRRRAVVAAETR